MSTLTHPQRLRRVAILCCHCLGNIAFYRAGWRDGTIILKNQFWLRANGNFVDIAVLEWCKLFADFNGEHHWRKVLTDQDSFCRGLLERLAISEEAFKEYMCQVRFYRDKFVAHLDREAQMDIPSLEIALESTRYLYDYLLKYEDTENCFRDVRGDSSWLYEESFTLGKATYERNI